MRYDSQLVLRCSGKLDRAINMWAKKTGQKPAEVARRVLEVAFDVQPDEIELPPGIKQLEPTQGKPH